MIKDLYDIAQWEDITEHQRIGEILMAAGKITLQHLDLALNLQKKSNLPLGELFVTMKIITGKDLKRSLVVQKYIDDKIS